ncbi:MAG TPA: hypothetical protein VMU82_14105 [Acetobacteraceae bacterium]|nr:hypothetical protein [Acetobacteraceae bacterium]
MDPAKLRESLRKQGIVVHESDPVLEVATICELSLADTVKAIEGLNKAAADRISATSTQTIDAAKRTAETIINQGAAFVVEQFREAVREATSTMLAELHQETARAERASRTAARIAWTLGSLGAIGLAGLSGFLLAGLGHG